MQTPIETNELQMMRPSEVSKLLRVSTRSVLDWIHRGIIPAFDIGMGNVNRYVIREADLIRFLSLNRFQVPLKRNVVVKRVETVGHDKAFLNAADKPHH